MKEPVSNFLSMHDNWVWHNDLAHVCCHLSFLILFWSCISAEELRGRGWLQRNRGSFLRGLDFELSSAACLASSSALVFPMMSQCPAIHRTVMLLWLMFSYSSSTSVRVGIEFRLCSSGCDEVPLSLPLSHQSDYQPHTDLFLSFRAAVTHSTAPFQILLSHLFSLNPLELPHPHRPWTENHFHNRISPCPVSPPS